MIEGETAEGEKPARRKRTPKPAESEICSQCWPNGWPGEDNGASCEHGTYQR